jgi:hypothetical protein
MASILAQVYKANCEGIKQAVKGLILDFQYERELYREDFHRAFLVCLHFGFWKKATWS